MNIERGEIELLNDASELLIDGYKVEGPGELVKTVNGGKTQLNLFNAAWGGNKIEDHVIFEIHNGEIDITGGNIFCYPENDRYCTALLVDNDKNERISLKECSIELSGLDALGRSWGRLIENIIITNHSADIYENR